LKLINKFLLCIGLLFLVGTISVFSFADEKNDIYKDDNKIVQQGDNYTFENKIGARISSNEIDIKYSGFSGTNTIWLLEVKEDGELSLNFDSTVDNGEFKMVLINSQKEIESILEGTEQGNKAIKLTKGKYVIKIVGRNAAGKIMVSINKNQNIKITKVDK
jgi:hypothetical protein